uniref:Uncharacterized protein n=1 Tax=Arundo donax TaxID=35708 RepID=A0A0A8XPL4_ARUDO
MCADANKERKIVNPSFLKLYLANQSNYPSVKKIWKNMIRM